MTRSIEEQLSALLDSELPVEEEALLLKRLESGTEHRRTLGRYALIGDLIRGTSVNRGMLGLSESVSAAVATEETHATRRTNASGRPGLAKGLAGAAIAASVALLALVNIGVFTGEDKVRPAPSIAQDGGAQPVAPLTEESIYTVPPPGAQRSNVIAPVRLTNYLVSHGEYSNSLSRQVMASYIVNQVPESATRQDSVDNAGQEAFE